MPRSAIITSVVLAMLCALGGAYGQLPTGEFSTELILSEMPTTVTSGVVQDDAIVCPGTADCANHAAMATIVLDTISPSTRRVARPELPASTTVSATSLIESTSAYTSVFEPMVVTIAVTYQPGEHAVSFDSRPPGLLSPAGQAVLRFGDRAGATSDGLAIFTTSAFRR